MTIVYGYRWFRAKKRLTETWDENRARAAHEKRELYVALIGQSATTSHFVEIVDDYVGVGFLDSFLREYKSYQFQELEQGRLFLTMATVREFEGDSDKVVSGITCYFKPDGLPVLR